MRYILNFIYLLALAVYLPVIAYQRILSGKKTPRNLDEISGWCCRQRWKRKMRLVPRRQSW